MSMAGDFLGRIVDRLNRAGIAHMVAGSFASTLHGTPRTTHDIDLVIEASLRDLVAFVRGLPDSEYYASEEAAREAFARRSQFNVIDMATGWKADLILRKDRPFSSEEFRRRMPGRLLDVEVAVATPEDTILSKLEWAKLSGSERQLADAAGVVAVRGADLDVEYVARWAAELGVLDLWERIAGRLV
jgi:hypothetical protein